MLKDYELRITLPNSETHEMVNEFLLHLQLSNRSEGTICVYRCFYEKFFANFRESYKEITSEQIIKWIKVNVKNQKETTINLKMSILSSFYKFCIAEGYMEKSPMKSRWKPKLPVALPKYLGKKDISKMVQQAEKNTVRNRLIIELFLSSGCRVAELVSIKREDMDEENRSISIVGKGKKRRFIHYSEKCALLFEQYFKGFPIEKGPIFRKKSGKQLTTRTIQYVLAKVGKEIDLNESLHPHRLRHTFATELLTKGADLGFIAGELGHSDTNTTLIYARLPNYELQKMYRKYMG